MLRWNGRLSLVMRDVWHHSHVLTLFLFMFKCCCIIQSVSALFDLHKQ